MKKKNREMHLLTIQQDWSWMSMLIDDELEQLEQVIDRDKFYRYEIFERLELCQRVLHDIEIHMNKVV